LTAALVGMRRSSSRRWRRPLAVRSRIARSIWSRSANSGEATVFSRISSSPVIGSGYMNRISLRTLAWSRSS
jgi:hypothetical protein